MSNELIVVTAATGNIGSKLSGLLLAKGKKIRVVGRDASKLETFKKKGAEAAVGNVEDQGFVEKAFAGAGAVFTLVPPNYGTPQFRAYQNKVGDIYAKALENSGATHVVNLSSVGAHLPEKVGPIKGLYDIEQKLNQLKANVIHLRPTFFMENTLMNIGLIKQMGINGTPMKASLKVSMIATADIAKAAAERLTNLNWTGKSVLELFGQRDLTMAEVTGIIGKAINKSDLKYVEFPYADAEKALLGMGMSADAAKNMVEMYQAFNDGIVKPTQSRNAETTTETSIEKFVETVFAKAYLN